MLGHQTVKIDGTFRILFYKIGVLCLVLGKVTVISRSTKTTLDEIYRDERTQSSAAIYGGLCREYLNSSVFSCFNFLIMVEKIFYAQKSRC
jgi:hypothetical protein